MDLTAAATLQADSKKAIRHYKNYLTPLRQLQLWIYGRRMRAARCLPFLAPSQTTALTPPSLLLQLPDELILEIASYLSPADLMSLQDASLQIPTLIDTATVQRIDRNHYANRLNRDDYARACAEDDAGNFWFRRLVCSACMDIHPRSCFSATARRTPAHRRRCIVGNAADTRLRICAHWSVTHAELKALLARRPQSIDGGKIYCPDPVHEDDPSQGVLATDAAVELRAYKPYENGMVHLHTTLMGVRVVPGDSHALREALAQVDEPVCRHLHTSQLRVAPSDAGSENVFFDLFGPETRRPRGTHVVCSKCDRRAGCMLCQFDAGNGMLEVYLYSYKFFRRDAPAEDRQWLALVEHH